MDTPLNPDRRLGPRIGPARMLPAWRKGALVAGCLAAAALSFAPGHGQQSSSPQVQRPIVIFNRDPDVHDYNDMAKKNARKRNYDAANEARKIQIDDEANKLLILARDLKAKTDKLESGALPQQLVREAEVIEFLANDVKQKMRLTVTGD